MTCFGSNVWILTLVLFLSLDTPVCLLPIKSSTTCWIRQLSIVNNLMSHHWINSSLSIIFVCWLSTARKKVGGNEAQALRVLSSQCLTSRYWEKILPTEETTPAGVVILWVQICVEQSSSKNPLLSAWNHYQIVLGANTIANAVNDKF